MKRQRNIKIKEQDKTLEKELKEMEASYLPKTEFKTLRLHLLSW